MKGQHKVLIMRCDAYDPDRISGIVREGMEELGVTPSGKILLKPNVVIAHPEVFPHAFTRKEFLEGVIVATKAMAQDAEEIAVGERSGITLPTRYNFRNAGYPKVIRKHRVRTYYFDEEVHVPVEIERDGRLRNELLIPKPVTLQDVIKSDFIAIDGITAGQKMMLTPTPFSLGAIVMGTNSCAVDTVGCHMVHVDPGDLIHLGYAADRGHGPMDLDEIEVGGDFPLEEVREKTWDFELCMERVDDYFGEESRLSCTVGTFPEKHSPDYCWGGCPGALQEAMHIFRGFDPNVDQEMGKVRYVVGKVDGPLDLEDDERVIFAGNCTSWKGVIDGKNVRIESSYKSSDARNGRKTRSNDMILKTLKTLWRCFRNRSARYIHAEGCTLSVAENVNYLSALGKIGNPNFHPRLLIPVNLAYWQMRAHRLLNRIFG
ncbi:MAG: DUF362 domain-containing protein [Deltaproteobacteria bacterium]|nr:DUF362 domain-containing protein [Deltaproteobacteria bacterium]